MNRPTCEPITAGTSAIVTASVPDFVTPPVEYVLVIVNAWFAATVAVVRTPAEMDAYAESSLHDAEGVTVSVEPSLNVAVAVYDAVLLSGTLDGPLMASDVSVRVGPLSQLAGAPATSRSALAEPCVALTRHGTVERPSTLVLQWPLRGVTVLRAVPVAALLIVTAASVGAVPDSVSFWPSQAARVTARLAAAAVAAMTSASASAPHVRVLIRSLLPGSRWTDCQRQVARSSSRGRRPGVRPDGHTSAVRTATRLTLRPISAGRQGPWTGPDLA